MVSAKAKAAAKATWRGVKKAAKTKQGQKLTYQLKSQAEEAFRQKMSEVPVAGLLGLCVKAASGSKPPKGADGVNLNEVSNRDISIIGGAKGDITTSASIYAYRPPRKRKLEGVNYIQKTRATRNAAASPGTQNVADISILDAMPVLNNPDSNSKYSNMTLKKAFDDFLLASNQGTDMLKLNQTSIHIKSITCDVTISNTNSTACIVDLYELLPQHALGPTTYSSEAYAEGYMSPFWCWKVGLATDSPMLEDSLLFNTVGSKPSDSVVYTRSWKQVKHVKINLTGNSTHIHKTAYAVNKTVSYQEYAQFSQSGGKLPGWNPTIMLAMKGVPDADNPLSNQCNISYYANLQMNYSGYMSEGARAIVFDDKT